MTIKELARLCGVSPSTVSRVVNAGESTAASPAVADRIWRMVHETGYVPNQAAQSLKRGTESKKPLHILCVFARLYRQDGGQFFEELFRAIEQEAAREGLRLTVHSLIEQLEAPLPPSDGVIVLGRCSRARIRAWQKRQKNIVMVGLNALSEPVCDQVVCDGYEAAAQAMEYLLSLGHRQIAYLGEQAEEARWRGYYDSLKKAGLPVQNEYVFTTPQTREGGAKVAPRLLAVTPLPTAVFCANDATATGLLEVLEREHISVPHTMSVIGIDNTLHCADCVPPLTSIGVPKDELGRLSLTVLLDRIAQRHYSPIRVDIPFHLVRRGSCAKASSQL